jgi:hypothetical protein
MHASRIRSLIGSVLLLGGLLGIAASPTSAATCTLTAPASAAIGSRLTVSAAGFPASAPVEVSITIEGKTPDTFTTQSDASGAFEINLMPEASDRGQTTVAATAGAGCAAEVVIAVGTAPLTPTPEASDAGVAGAGAEPPRTDGASPSADATPMTGVGVWLAFILLAAGIGGLLLTRPVRSR